MSILAGIFAVLALVFFLAAFVGLLAPSIFRNRSTGEVPSRWQLLSTGLVVSLVACLITGAIEPKQTDVADAKAPTTQNPIQPKSVASLAESKTSNNNAANEKVVSLGITPEQFRRSFNSIAGQIHDSYRTAEFDIQPGAVNDVFTRSFGEDVAIVGSVSKSDGSLLGLMVTISSDSKDVAKPIAVLLAATQALNPNIPKEKNSKVVLDMFQKSLAEIETGKSFKNTVGNLRYTASASRHAGLLFSVVNDES